MGQRKVDTGFWWGNLRVGDHSEHPDVDGKIILKWIFEKWIGHGLDRSGSGQGQMAGCCECGNEPSCSTKCVEFLDQLRTCQLLRKAFALSSQFFSMPLIYVIYNNQYFYQKSDCQPSNTTTCPCPVTGPVTSVISSSKTTSLRSR